MFDAIANSRRRLAFVLMLSALWPSSASALERIYPQNRIKASSNVAATPVLTRQHLSRRLHWRSTTSKLRVAVGGRYFIEAPQKAIESILELNGYSYALNNPVSFRDPSGECADPVSGFACGAIVGSIVGAAANATSQVIGMLAGNGKTFSGGDVLTAGVRGALVGGAIGATKGADGGALAIAAAGGGANVVTGIGERALRQQDPFDVASMGVDVVGGAMGGAVAGLRSSSSLITSAVRASASGIDDATLASISTFSQNLARDVAGAGLNISTDATIGVIGSTISSGLGGSGSDCAPGTSCPP